MTTPENPERLIARVHADGSGMVCVYAVPQYASPPTQDTWVPYEPSKPSDYIRSDRAAAEMAAQVEINAALHDYSDDITVRICQMAEDLGLKSEPLEVEPDAAEVLSAIHDVLGERDALRRERDALLSGSFVQKVAAERDAYRTALEKIAAILVPGEVWEPWEAKETAEAALAAEKVVG